MFANLFKPKWRHSDPDVRASAVHKLQPDHPEQAVILRQLALNDSNPQVRLSAVRRLSDADSLLQVLQQSTDPDIRLQAGLRVSECLDSHESQTELARLLEQIDDTNARTQIIIHTRSPHIESQTLNGIDDEKVLMDIALNARLADIRKEAANRIYDTELLEEVQRASRGRDKTVHRISRDKLNQLREQARRASEQQQRRLQLLEQLHQLTLTEDTQYLQARVQALHQDWQQLETASADDQHRFDQLYQQVAQRLQEQADAEARLRRQQAEQAAREARILALQTALKELLNTLPTSADALESELNTLDAKWQSLALPQDGGAARHWQANMSKARLLQQAQARLEQHEAEIQSLLKAEPDPERLRPLRKLLNTLDWPKAAAQPEPLQQLNTLQQQLKQEQDQLRQEARQHSDEVARQLDTLEAALDSGHQVEADRLHGLLAQHMERLNGLLPDSLEARFRALNARLAELHDWQGFAAAGKKEALCEQMEALVGVDMQPQPLADRIRALQQEWKQVDATDPVHSQKLWKRFHDAGEKAYAPCQAWFGSQRKQREFNLAQRQQICDQLALYLEQMDWSQADWPAVEAVSRTAREEWRTFTPVDRAPGKPLQQQFNALLRDLDQHIKHHRQQCADIKEALIARAAELAEQDDAQTAAQEAKQLQQQWKAAGPTFRSRERALWQAFREHCDTIFARLKRQRREQTEQERKQAQEAARQPLADTAVEALQRLAFLAEQAEEELVTQGSSDTLATLLTEAITGPSPGAPWRELIGQRMEVIRLLSAGGRSIEEQLVLSERQARELCIRLEILLGQPSPEDDEALRMEYQMERLSQALAQQDDEPTPAALQALELEWLTLPFAWQFTELHERFVHQLHSA